MWLLPIFSEMSALALRLFYRFEVAGERVPASGPVLLVANHPNSLLDPASVVAAAGRPVRFLAKAPLFSDPKVGWLIRAAGAIPVYRRSDDPALMERNDETFRAAHAALAEGHAMGIFPEGLSHNAPALAPLKTGAARIALGAAGATGSDFPIVPVGLSFRRKEQFRSEALAVTGAPIEWGDLWSAGMDADAVRELTERIERGLRAVTVNLESWADAPLIEAAEEIVAAEMAPETDPARRVARRAEAGESLRRVRAEKPEGWEALAEDVRRHARLLSRLGLRPEQLGAPPPGVVARWIARQIVLFSALALPALLGAAAYYLPYRLTGAIEARARPPQDVRATYKLLGGGLLHIAWTIALAGIAGWLGGRWWGVGALLLLPVCGLCTVFLRDRLAGATGEVRRFLVRTRRGDALRELRARQSELASRIGRLRERLAPRSPAV